MKLHCKAFVRDPYRETMEHGYVHVATLRKDEDAAQEALSAQFMRIRGLLKRARDIAKVLNSLELAQNVLNAMRAD